MKITKLKSNYCLSQNWKSNSVLSKFVFRGKKNKTKGRVWIAGEDKSQEHLPQKDRIEYKARKIMTPGDQYMTYADNTKLWIDIIRSVTKDGVKVISVVTHSNLFIGRPQSGNTFIDDFRGLTRDFSKNRQAMMNSGAVLVLRACLTSDITAQKIAELTGLTVIYFNPRTANKGKKKH